MKPYIGACSFALGLTLLHLSCHPWTSEPSQTRDPQREGLGVRVLVSGLADPFELSWGPDDALWVTERTGKRVTRVLVPSGRTVTLFTADEAVATPGAQDGLLGMALDPRLLDGSGHDFVYIAYTYDADPSPDALDRRAKIVRLTHDAATGQLGAPVDLISGMPASTTNNSGRLAFGPDERLYYTIGDQGNDGEAHPCEPNLAQALPTAEEVAKADWTTYQGKVLRIALDGSIPDDNPVLEGVRSHVYSCGHRNAQGLTFGPDGKLFVAEHGPRTDDEINLVEPGMNYGWPHVAGHQDDQAYAYAKWSASVSPACQDLEYSEMEIPASVPQQKESAWSHPDFRPPLATFYTVPSDHDFADPACEGGPAYLCWPTIAPSSILVYDKHPAWIPGLAGSLVVTSLKRGQVLSLEMGIDGLPTRGAEPKVLLTTTDRLRDMALSPDGRALYVTTDAAGSMMSPDGEPTKDLAHQGAILEVRTVD